MKLGRKLQWDAEKEDSHRRPRSQRDARPSLPQTLGRCPEELQTVTRRNVPCHHRRRRRLPCSLRGAHARWASSPDCFVIAAPAAHRASNCSRRPMPSAPAACRPARLRSSPSYLKKVRKKNGRTRHVPGGDAVPCRRPRTPLSSRRPCRRPRRCGAECIRTVCLIRPTLRDVQLARAVEGLRRRIQCRRSRAPLPIADKQKIPARHREPQGLDRRRDGRRSSRTTPASTWASASTSATTCRCSTTRWNVVEAPGALRHQHPHQGHGRRRVRGRIPAFRGASRHRASAI